MAPNESETAPGATSSSPHHQIKINTASPAMNSCSQSVVHVAADLAEEYALQNLTATVRNHDDVERDITAQASRALIDAENDKDHKRIEKNRQAKLRLENLRRKEEQKLQSPIGLTLRGRAKKEIQRIDGELEICNQEITAFCARIDQRHQNGDADEAVGNAGGKLANETQREYLIRTGKITPFSHISGPRAEGFHGELSDALIAAEEEAAAEELEVRQDEGRRSHRHLRRPGFGEASNVPTSCSAVESEFFVGPRKKRKLCRDGYEEYSPVASKADSPDNAEEDGDSDEFLSVTPKSLGRRKRSGKATEGKDEFCGIDDGNEAMYQSRLQDWVDRRSRTRRSRQEGLGQPEGPTMANEEEWFKPCPDKADHVFGNGLKLPGDIYPSLFDYQKTGVKWLAELYAQQVGGIIGDEMGLGKTVQLISFVAALHYSKLLDKPVIVVAPATLLRQWVDEFHRWWPPLRVSILHASGSGMFNAHSDDESEDDMYESGMEKPKKSSKAGRDIVNRVVKHGHVLVTTYAGLQTFNDALVSVQWGYAVLDEGHKIRNPNTSITVYCKELQTANRIILSGTPLQNNLTELWSLFDFIYPMRLGTLVSFRNQFEIPIKMGGYANANKLQIMTAQKCAETLKDAISPYLLQRMKVDVAADLPRKREQVLFCKLTKEQRDAYEAFLGSDDMSAILNRTRQSLYGIDILRKICNHVDLVNPKLGQQAGYMWGRASKSGKMQVVKSLLPIWKRLGHKTLLFSQGRQMLDILEAFIGRQDGIRYIRMDGKTPVKERQSLVDRFNNDAGLDVFLLTTKVGGLGVNLTGANRVILFDPDWNPSTDVQARERVWRLGQKKEVTIYRLMTAGTIEEKMYHRQIFKQFLTNKVLRDPKQRTTFNLSDLHDLFSLNSYENGATETSELFKGSQVKKWRPSGPRELIVPGSELGHLKLRPGGSSKAHVGAKAEAEEDLGRIEGIASLEAYESGDDAIPSNEEDRLMEGIFARSVHSALEHEQIMNSRGNKVQADRGMLRAEANRVAAEAAAALRRAEASARAVPIGTVTWTGAVGEAGRPRRPNNGSRGRTGPSSSSILNRVASRQGLDTALPATSAGLGSAMPARKTLKAKDFEKMIPDFIKRHGGQVPSKLLVDHFNQFCSMTRMADEFKRALGTVAKMEKAGSRMRAMWKLKPAYQ